MGASSTTKGCDLADRSQAALLVGVVMVDKVDDGVPTDGEVGTLLLVLLF